MRTVIIERDVLKDRIITEEELAQLTKYLKTWNFKYYILVSLLAITGARPAEVQALTIDDFDITDHRNPKVRIDIRKSKVTVKDDVRKITRKFLWRPLPFWFIEDLTSYLKDTRRAGRFVFPADKYGRPQTSIHAQFAKIRNHLYKKGDNWHWVKDVYQQFDTGGRLRRYYRFSPYALRKYHAVKYLKLCSDMGDMNAIVCTAKHMGHSDTKTTMKYLAVILKEREMIDTHGFMSMPFEAQQTNLIEILEKLNKRIEEIEKKMG